MIYHKLIPGANFTDERGQLIFFNAFDMASVVRFYEIAPKDTDTVRAWQGHKGEKKWFYCNAGAFVVNLIQLDDFESPSSKLKPERLLLETKNPRVLEISGGYATGFIGKWHMAGADHKTLQQEYLPKNHGFDMNIGGCSMGGPGGDSAYFDPFTIPTIENRKKGEYLPDRLADEAINYMKKQKDLDNSLLGIQKVD